MEIAIIIILLGTCIVLLRVLLQEKERIRFMKNEHRKEMVEYSDKIAQRTKDIYTLIDNENWSEVEDVKSRYVFYREMEEFMWFGSHDPEIIKIKARRKGFTWIPDFKEEEVVGDGFMTEESGPRPSSETINAMESHRQVFLSAADYKQNTIDFYVQQLNKGKISLEKFMDAYEINVCKIKFFEQYPLTPNDCLPV